MSILAYNPESPSSSSTNREEHDGNVCVANISPRERLKRLIGGVIPFLISIAILSWLLAIHADRWWRLPLFFLFAGATVGFFQWRDKT
ncbi:MAG: hypothetical protein ACM3MF_03940 [Anaerolineae bacterium]